MPLDLIYKCEHLSQDLSYLVNAPIGAIMIWSGTENNVPEGWSICNGQNGTVDLRDKFVLDAGESHNVGETGGSEEVTLTVAQMPKHNHQIETFIYDSGSGTVKIKRAVQPDGTATMPINAMSIAGSSQPHPNMPPYYTLLYIQKTGVTPSDYATVEQVEEIIDSIISDGNPVGTIISYMGVTAPTGYLICDGTVYNIDDYQDLANHIKAQFGDVKYFGGNGTTTFAVPDMRNLFLRGYHGASSEKLSGDIGKKQEATPIPNTSMGYTSGAPHLLGLQVSETSTFNYTTKNYDTAVASSIQRGIKITTGAASGGVPATFTARPVNMAVLYCIKT